MSWEQLEAITREAVEHRRAERARPPTVCPYDVETLRAGPHGGLFCPWGDYLWPRDGRPDLPLL